MAAWSALVGDPTAIEPGAGPAGGPAPSDDDSWGPFHRDPCGVFGSGAGTDACSQRDDYGRDSDNGGGNDH